MWDDNILNLPVIIICIWSRGKKYAEKRHCIRKKDNIRQEKKREKKEKRFSYISFSESDFDRFFFRKKKLYASIRKWIKIHTEQN